MNEFCYMEDAKLRKDRRDYVRGSLEEANVPSNPLELFDEWYQQWESTGRPDVTAMTLATSDADGQPDARIVLLKGIEGGRFTFYTNYNSAKGKQLDENPKACLMFFWPEHERQVRVYGEVARLSYDENQKYFKERPVASQIGAISSPQSGVIENRDILEEAVKTNTELYGADGPDCPLFWGGYGMLPTRIEFWQGRASRLHDRLSYSIENGAWKIVRLAP